MYFYLCKYLLRNSVLSYSGISHIYKHVYTLRFDYIKHPGIVD